MRPYIFKTGFVLWSVGQSVRRSACPPVRLSVTYLSKTREINIFKQIIPRGGIIGSLDASYHLYKMVYLFIGLSIHQWKSTVWNESKLKSRKISFKHVITQLFLQHEDASLALWAFCWYVWRSSPFCNYRTMQKGSEIQSLMSWLNSRASGPL